MLRQPLRIIALGTFACSTGLAPPGYTPITVSKAVPNTIYMKRVLPSALVGWFINYARKLKYPQLFKWLCALFLIDVIIPDLIPFVDEILLGLATLFLASWKKHGNAPDHTTELRTEDDSSRQEKVITGQAEKLDEPEEQPVTREKYGKH